MRKKTILQTTCLASIMMLTMLCPTMKIPAAEVTASEQTEGAENDTFVDDEEGWEDDEEEVEEDEETSTNGESTEETSEGTPPEEWTFDETWNTNGSSGKQSVSQNTNKKSTKSVKAKASGSYDRSFRTGVQEHMAWIASLAAIFLFMGIAFMIWAHRIKRHARKELQSINRFEQDRTDS